MALPTKFSLKGHALQRSKERGISKQLFIKTVVSPNKKTRQHEGKGTHGGIVYAFERVEENKNITIIAEIHKDTCYFITGYQTT